MVSAIQSFISTRLINEVTPVTFLDLCDEFSITASRAKNQMIEYYSNTKHESVQCIILSILKNKTVQMVHDPEILPPKEDILDMFIYAFNPLETVDLTNKERKVLSIKNPYAVSFEETQQPAHLRSKTAEQSKPVISIPTQEAEPDIKAKPVIQRSKTLPEPKKEPKKAQDMGLKSTALLARMRKDREEKERQRQEELLKRRQDSVVMTQEKKQQMDQLASMFDDDDEEDFSNINANKDDQSDTEPIAIGSLDSSPCKETEKSTERSKSVTIEPENLEEILETTNEESLLELSQTTSKPTVMVEKTNAPEAYVDEDGYLVTSRQLPQKKPSKRSATFSTILKLPPNTTKVPSKKKARMGQSTLESFFGKKKR